jgi:enoyl-CoA hydratase
VAEASTEPVVLTEPRGAVLVITLNRPAARNAIDHALAAAIAAATDALDADDRYRAGVITGAGKGFCAGMDLKGFVADGPSPWIPGRGFAGIVERPPAKPVVAAVEGFAVAGGLEVALACDLIVAGSDARFGVPEVKRGLMATGGALRRLPARVSLGVAMELALTGELIEAERAHAVGLVDRVVEPGAALAAAVELAESIAANAPLALVATKQVLGRQADWDGAAFWGEQAKISDPVMTSADAEEGARAFAEKRPPVWTGR